MTIELKTSKAFEAIMTRTRPPRWAKRRVTRASGLVEYVCLHGVGHPTEESIKDMTLKYGDWHWGRHGCCGCCIRRKKPEEKR